jgi:large subunit ribosomal protein L4e
MAQKTAEIFDLQGKSRQNYSSTSFPTPLRPDVIKRAVLAIQSSRIQPQGRDPMAGKKTTAESRGTGSAIARVPRVKGGRAEQLLLQAPLKADSPIRQKVCEKT